MRAPDSKRSWFRLSPNRFVTGLLLVIGLLWLSERFQWFAFNHRKGWTVLIAVATVGAAALVMVLLWAVALVFHWRFQFGIRSLLVFCLVCSIAAGWLAVEMKRARRQAETVEWVQKSGQQVALEPPGPEWLQDRLGVDFFSDVVWVSLYRTWIKDDRLENIRHLTTLRHLDLRDTLVTDAGLQCLTELASLQELYLNDTLVTDAGLKQLKGLTQLQRLNLDRTRITDVGLERLEELTQLRELWIGNTKVTDAGVDRLRQALPACTIYSYHY